MPSEPAEKRTVAFVDGQNLFYAAKECFGYTYPNYDVLALATAICTLKGWSLVGTWFYTGIPDRAGDLRRHGFWESKLLSMSRQGVYVFSRPLRYSTDARFPPEEKGVDIRIALDVIRLALKREYDVALLFSQDQDLSEVAAEIRLIAREQRRWIRIASAFPCAQHQVNRRGVNKTESDRDRANDL